MSTSNPYKPLVKIARYYIDFPEEKFLYHQVYVTAMMDSAPFSVHTHISCGRGVLKKDMWDLKQGMTFDHWFMGICNKKYQARRGEYGDMNACKYCQGEGCIFFNIGLRYLGNPIIYATVWENDNEIDQTNNKVIFYSKRVNMNEIPEISHILNQK